MLYHSIASHQHHVVTASCARAAVGVCVYKIGKQKNSTRTLYSLARASGEAAWNTPPPSPLLLLPLLLSTPLPFGPMDADAEGDTDTAPEGERSAANKRASSSFPPSHLV